MLGGPLGQDVVESIESDCFVWASFGPELFHVKSFDQLAVHEQQQVQSFDISHDVALAEVRVEFLKREVLVDLLPLGLEETSDFLDSCELLKKVSVLELSVVLRVVAHEVLSKEDAGVEAGADARVDLGRAVFVRHAVDLS